MDDGINCNEYGVLEDVLLGTPSVETFCHCPNVSALRGLFHSSRIPCGPACEPAEVDVRQAIRELDNFRRVLLDQNVKVHQVAPTSSRARRSATGFIAEPFEFDGKRFEHRYNVANVRDMFFTYGRNVIVAPMGKAESRDETDFYVPLLEKFCHEHEHKLIQPPEFKMKILDNNEEPKSILSLIPKRRCPRPCCLAAIVGSTGKSTDPQHVAGEDSPKAVNDYEVYQTSAQKKRFRNFCQAPWFPVDESPAPLFETADFAKLDHIIVGIRSAITNRPGIEWVRQTVGSFSPNSFVLEARHSIGHYMDVPWHIDTTLVPVSKDIVLCAERKMIDDKTAQQLRVAGLRLVPVPASQKDGSFWHMNLLGLGHRRLVIDNSNRRFNEQLKSLGFKTIPIPMMACRHAYQGMLHCTTLDLLRRKE